MDTVMVEEIQYLGRIVEISSEFIVNYGFQFIGAIIILLIGWQVARWASRLTLKICERAKLDVTLAKFFSNVAKTLVIIFVVIIALGKFGITIAPFIAALGAVAFGGTLALQGPLSNYGAGLTIVITRPFIVGDTIRLVGVTGIVEDIKLAYTQLSNEDGELITIPNKQIVGEIISNTYACLLVESTIRISYENDPKVAVRCIAELLGKEEAVAREPAPLVGIEKFGESAYEIGLRYWLPTKRYYELMYSINGKIQEVLQEKGITLARPNVDVHMQPDSP